SINKKIILFGGERGGGYLNDTWEYDYSANHWNNRNPSLFPDSRSGHSMTFDRKNGKTIMFGGYNGTHQLNDTWIYDYSNNNWTRLSLSTSPPERSDFDAVYDSINEVTLIFGGINGSWIWNDLWVFDYPTATWSEISLPSTFQRYQHNLAFDSFNGHTILFGGNNGSGFIPDTWKLDLFINRTQTTTTTQTVTISQETNCTCTDATTSTIIGNHTETSIITETQTEILTQTGTQTITDTDAGIAGSEKLYAISLSSIILIIIIRKSNKKSPIY
ncbi:MAG: Kelch repeat-containing protein, partial [Candidatus Kariarchaeaceae archaeon]